MSFNVFTLQDRQMFERAHQQLGKKSIDAVKGRLGEGIFDAAENPLEQGMLEHLCPGEMEIRQAGLRELDEIYPTLDAKWQRWFRDQVPQRRCRRWWSRNRKTRSTATILRSLRTLIHISGPCMELIECAGLNRLARAVADITELDLEHWLTLMPAGWRSQLRCSWQILSCEEPIKKEAVTIRAEFGQEEKA